MGYPQFSVKFGDQRRKLSKWEIDAAYMDYFNRGIACIPTISGPTFLEEWRRDAYRANGIAEHADDKHVNPSDIGG